MKRSIILAIATILFAGHAMVAFAGGCPFEGAAGSSSFCCSHEDCHKMLGYEFHCSSMKYQCAKCGTDASVPACKEAPRPMPPTYRPPMYGTYGVYPPPPKPCTVKPVSGFCCNDADCFAQTGQKFVYCNTVYNQCNACGLYKTPKCPGGQTPVDGACPYAGRNNDGTFCCADSDCRNALNSTYVYCNTNFFQCNACGLAGTPPCPARTPVPAPTYASRPGYGYPGYYGCSESKYQCCSDLTCQKAINNPYVFCNTTYFQCNACGNMANQACCPGSICRTGFTCTSGVCIQTGYVPPAAAMAGIIVGCAVAAVAVVAGVATVVRRRQLRSKQAKNLMQARTDSETSSHPKTP